MAFSGHWGIWNYQWEAPDSSPLSPTPTSTPTVEGASGRRGHPSLVKDYDEALNDQVAEQLAKVITDAYPANP
jgi:hypothetical protein